MSKKHYKHDDCKKNTWFGLGDCCCDFPTLIILILIILQFNKKGSWGGFKTAVADDVCGAPAPAPIAPTYFGGGGLIDNSILFIIALYFLSCCNPCRK